MTGVMQTVLFVSIRSSIVIAAVLLLRLLFGRAPKWTRLVLWGIAALSLLLPVGIQSRVSLMPEFIVDQTDTFFEAGLTGDFPSEVPAPKGNMQEGNNPAEEKAMEDAGGSHGAAVSSGTDSASIFSKAQQASGTASFRTFLSAALTGKRGQTGLFILWLFGTLSMLIYTSLSYLKLRRCVSASIEEDGVYLCDSIEAPFILDVIRPRIYLPSGIQGKEREMILAHEKAHIKGLHHIFKAGGFLLLSLYWFHPLVWAAWLLFTRDLEMACDERVIRELRLDKSRRADYSETLLAFSSGHRRLAPCPLAFGENDVKSRVREVLNYKKAPFWIILAVLILGAAAGVVFLTIPKTAKLSMGEYPLNDSRIRPAMSREELTQILGELDPPAEGERQNEYRYSKPIQTVFGTASEARFVFSTIPVKMSDGGESSLGYVDGLSQIIFTVPDVSGIEEGEKLLTKTYGKFDSKKDGPNITFLKNQNESMLDDSAKDAVQHNLEYQYDYPAWRISSLPEEALGRFQATVELINQRTPGIGLTIPDETNLMRIVLYGRDDRPGLSVSIDSYLWSVVYENPDHAVPAGETLTPANPTGSQVRPEQLEAAKAYAELFGEEFSEKFAPYILTEKYEFQGAYEGIRVESVLSDEHVVMMVLSEEQNRSGTGSIFSPRLASEDVNFLHNAVYNLSYQEESSRSYKLTYATCTGKADTVHLGLWQGSGTVDPDSWMEVKLSPLPALHSDGDDDFGNIAVSMLSVWAEDHTLAGKENTIQDAWPAHDLYVQLNDGNRIGGTRAEFADGTVLCKGEEWVHDKVGYLSALFPDLPGTDLMSSVVIDGKEYLLNH